MKNKEFKPCADKNCNNDFKPFKSTDKYCSPSCFYKNKTADKPRIKIRQKSKKQATLDRTYSVLRKTFLKLPENKLCPVASYFVTQTINPIEERRLWLNSVDATEIHHKAGRVGKLYLYVPFWLAVSRKGHVWIHKNPKEAYQKGWLIKSTSV